MLEAAPIIYEVEQGSPEWHELRAGCVTASMFSVAREWVGGLDSRQQAFVDLVRAGTPVEEATERAGYKARPKSDRVERALDGERVGEPSAAAKDYAFRLAIERISGTVLDEGFETWSMRRGRELEPAARALHALHFDLEIEHAGFVKTADGRFGASADGLIEPEGGAEYKCFIDPSKLRSILIDRDTSTVHDQVQGCLWITGRKWWHSGFYCPALEPCQRELTIIPMWRDDRYIEALEADLVRFERMVEEYESALRGTSDALPGVDDIASGIQPEHAD